ncbi:hypothetical protein E4U42_004776 [Claviceps africana]|uniref:Ubiquitin interaction domain-containing protein n=1 Tax=Claviceps africana TaxID=83212 RepID=A0A8K0J4N0_9HYPO|nr:hypothetical protein E4U42_004776 [Claviceps africana]
MRRRALRQVRPALSDSDRQARVHHDGPPRRSTTTVHHGSPPPTTARHPAAAIQAKLPAGVSPQTPKSAAPSCLPSRQHLDRTAPTSNSHHASASSLLPHPPIAPAITVANMASRPPPSEDEISQVIDFAGLSPQDDRPMVIQALKDNNCNVESVVMQYFDNSESFRKKFTELWNESMFTADRDGTTNNTGISFHIESTNDNVIQGVSPPPEPYVATAPSRPPSRSNNMSPLGRMLDWAGHDVPVPTGVSREDQDMQRALRESAQEAGIGLVDQQQSGITISSSPAAPAFGPANRNDYDEGSWAMVPSFPSEARAPRDPPPSLRKRAAGAPAFLVQGINAVGNHALGGMLTVMHEIPMARNALLKIGSQAASYGFHSEWWKGREIFPPDLLARLQAGDEVPWVQQDHYKPDAEEEIHRLMAFLECTERSYGTVSVLTNLIPCPSLGPEKQLYEYLGPRNEQALRVLTHSAVLAPVFGDDSEKEEARFALLELEHARQDYMCITTLYESLDHTMWSDAFAPHGLHQGSKMAMFKDMGDVLTIKLNGEGPAQSVDIPEKLYLERYQTCRKDEARRIQLAWSETKKAIARIASEEVKVHEWLNDWNNMAFDREQMIRRAKEQWEAYSQYLESLGRFRQMEASGFDTDKYPDYRMAPLDLVSDADIDAKYRVVQDVLGLTSTMLADMEARVKYHSARLEQIKSKQRFLGRLLTQPNKPGRPQPMTCKEFLLRGVVTQSDVVYVCQRVEPDSMQLEGECKPVDQWWRLAYKPNDGQPVKTEASHSGPWPWHKIGVEQVLQDVWNETKVPLLIYATKAALTVARTPLPLPLQRFALAENEAFQAELQQETAEAAGEGNGKKLVASPVDPISPSKRKHRADSIDSMDSNRASLGSDDGQAGFDFEDDPDSTATVTASGTPATEASQDVVMQASRDEEVQ